MEVARRRHAQRVQRERAFMVHDVAGLHEESSASAGSNVLVLSAADRRVVSEFLMGTAALLVAFSATAVAEP